MEHPMSYKEYIHVVAIILDCGMPPFLWGEVLYILHTTVLISYDENPGEPDLAITPLMKALKAHSELN